MHRRFDNPPPPRFSHAVPEAPANTRAADQAVVLFTAFEPSGDDHAAAVIRELRTRNPDLRIFGWGGPHMEKAGAELVERTGDDAVVGLPGPAKIREHLQTCSRIKHWLQTHRVDVHVPVDSPAANFPICKLSRKAGARVVHLVAPQLWAWGPWRVRKLRRLTDLVLCLLPFEESWFRDRGVEAKFIGHPLFDTPVASEEQADHAEDLPSGEPRIALMPGSRPAELRRNFPIMLDAFSQLRARHTGAAGLVAATTPEVAATLREMANAHGGWPEGLEMVAARTDEVIRWSQIALVVSGTVTLQIARQRRPMVIFYKSNPLMYSLLARWLLSTEFLTLPNLIAGREIVPELVPHFGDAQQIVREADALLQAEEKADAQRQELARIADVFQGRHAGASAADAIEEVLGLRQPA